MKKLPLLEYKSNSLYFEILVVIVVTVVTLVTVVTVVTVVTFMTKKCYHQKKLTCLIREGLKKNSKLSTFSG